MRKNVSFLLGSGFSIPAGIPGVPQLNVRFSEVPENEIMIHSSMTVIRLNGLEDNNRWMNWDQRLFVQELLEFYNEEILPEGASFHYETFYDFYSGYIDAEENKAEIEGFYERFGKKHFKDRPDTRKCRDRMNDFDNAFNQLLAAELLNVAHLEDIGLGNYPYGGFFGFLSSLVQQADIKVHSLNHDLFFDFVASKHSNLWENYSDGFELEGSPYYGDLNHQFSTGEGRKISKSYKVKLSRFIDKFDTALQFFKLHGSVFTSKVFSRDQKNPVVRIKKDYAVSNFYQEVVDSESGQARFEYLFDDTSPDFLSGTTNKTRYYTRDPYYVRLFQHFQENLQNSELLFVIGYGFQDKGINEYLEENFLKRGSQMIVINPSKPKTDLIDKYGSKHISQGVTDLSYDEYMALLPEEFLKEPDKTIDNGLPSLEDLKLE